MTKCFAVALSLLTILSCFSGCLPHSPNADSITSYTPDTYDAIIPDTHDISQQLAGLSEESLDKWSVQIGKQSVNYPSDAASGPYGAYTVINNNVPFFTSEDIVAESYESYGELDTFGRCSACTACVGLELMPNEERMSIGQVKPTGWHTVKYDCVDGKYLYNRCHLIGYQLTGENANIANLITGTRFLNVNGMLPFENMVADYVRETENHVMYRVTPIYVGNELLVRGVLMEGQSVEDDDILFCVFCFNVQPGITIRYADGESWLNKETTT